MLIQGQYEVKYFTDVFPKLCCFLMSLTKDSENKVLLMVLTKRKMLRMICGVTSRDSISSSEIAERWKDGEGDSVLDGSNVGREEGRILKWVES